MSVESMIARQFSRPVAAVVDRQTERVAATAIDQQAGHVAVTAAEERAQETFFQRMGRSASVVMIGLFRDHPKLGDAYNNAYAWLSMPRFDTPKLSNVGNLTGKLTRMGQPTRSGFQTLRKEGYNTVINLRAETQFEKPLAEDAGLKYLYIPMPAEGMPKLADGFKFLEFTTNPIYGKVAFHCQRGADRTGAMAAIYRICAQDWPLEKALGEMPQYHFAAGFEDANRDFVREFAAHWKTLPAAERATVLHRMAPRYNADGSLLLMRNSTPAVSFSA